MVITTRALDTALIRKDFPILDQEIEGKPLVYLDNAATSQTPEPVVQAIVRYYHRDNANVHRGVHELSRRATTAYEDARGRIAEFVGARSAKEIVWTRGTSEAVNLVAYSWGGANVAEGDEMILSVQDHHSNLVPWQLLAERTGAILRYLDLDDQGRLRLDQLDELLGARTRIVAIAHVSNALGTINPVRTIADRVHAAGALLLVDGAQGAPHLPIDVGALDCDFYAISGHKMLGPTGVGALWARHEILEAMPPFQGGGEMIAEVDKEGSTWAEVPHKFEAGTPNIAGAVGIAAAADYICSLGHDAILEHERELVAYAIDRLLAIPGIRIWGPEDLSERSGVVSFTLDGAHPQDVAHLLDAEGIAVRSGHHCAQLVMKRYEVTATVRASFSVYNTLEEVDSLADALERARVILVE